MSNSRVLVAILFAVSSTTLVVAQQEYGDLPPGLEALRQTASSKTEFTLDHSMLVLASRLDSENDDLLRVIAGVSGVSVHRYHFAGHWEYDPQALHSLKDQYRAHGWMQIVNKHDKNGMPGVTDLWVHWQNDAISNIAILVARSEEVDFIEVSGSISPFDLTHLGGHFGIPKIEGGMRVPSPVSALQALGMVAPLRHLY